MNEKFCDQISTSPQQDLLIFQVSLCLIVRNIKRVPKIKDDANYKARSAFTYMLEVGCIVEVSDVNASTSGGVRSLHGDQLGEFDPPEVPLGCRTET